MRTKEVPGLSESVSEVSAGHKRGQQTGCGTPDPGVVIGQ